MERKPVTSSNVKSVGYDPETKRLHVEFKGGGVYEYSDVSQEKYDAMMKADSIGGHVHKHIKGAHSHKKL